MDVRMAIETEKLLRFSVDLPCAIYFRFYLLNNF